MSIQISCYARKTIHKLLITVLLAALATQLAPQPARAAPSFIVNSPGDVAASAPLNNGVCETAPGNHVCTLRAAIMKANYYFGGGVTIQLDNITYQLTIAKAGADDETTGDLNISNSMSVVGGNSSGTIIQGGGVSNDRVFHVMAGTLTLTRLTIQNGNCGPANCDGGGLLVESGSALVLNNSRVNNNASTRFGGGIMNRGNLTLNYSAVSGNNSSQGGGIYNVYGGIPPNPGTDGKLVVSNSTVSGNNAVYEGGGLDTYEGSVTLINSTVSGNNTNNGGGIIIDGTYALVAIINSTVSGNNAAINGGGLYSYKGTANLFSSTIAFNQADSDFDGTGTGGGVYQALGSVNFQNSIIALNGETAKSFSIWVPVYGDCAGTITAQGYSIINTYDTSHCTVNGSFNLADPQLGPLQNNGGATQTHALLAGSPAIDAGNPGGCTDNLGAILTSDQRGFGRPANGGISLRCDIGAYEYYRFGLFLPLIRR